MQRLIMKKFFIILFIFAAVQSYAYSVTDMRGKQIEIPEKLERVATIDDGLLKEL